MKVGLLVTGSMEAEGLPSSLETLFPGHEFSLVSGAHVNSFTGGRLTWPPAKGGALDKIVQELAASLVPGRRGAEPFDFVYVLEDLELENAGQPEVVVSCFVEAVKRHLLKLETETNFRFVEKLKEALRTKASFHFAVPMVESWLFGDPKGPTNAGVPEDRLPPCLKDADLLEDFETSHESYSSDQGCQGWLALSSVEQHRKKKTHKPLWLRDDRAKHPKAYLAWLCRSPSEKKCSTYRESGSRPGQPTGADALKKIDWNCLLARSYPFLFSFLEDLSDALKHDLVGFSSSNVAMLTSIQKKHDPLLRNISTFQNQQPCQTSRGQGV